MKCKGYDSSYFLSKGEGILKIERRVAGVIRGRPILTLEMEEATPPTLDLLRMILLFYSKA